MKTIAIRFFNVTGMKWGIPFVKLFTGDEVLEQLKEIWKTLLLPVLAITIFLFGWYIGAKQIDTSLGQVPGPVMVWEQAQSLWT